MQQNVSEWIQALLEKFETILPGDLQEYLRDLFLVESTITYRCDLNHQSQIKAVHNSLQLLVIDEKGNILISLNDIVNNDFQEKLVVKDFHQCDKTTSKKWEIITKYPQVPLLQ